MAVAEAAKRRVGLCANAAAAMVGLATARHASPGDNAAATTSGVHCPDLTHHSIGNDMSNGSRQYPSRVITNASVPAVNAQNAAIPGHNGSNANGAAISAAGNVYRKPAL